MTELEAPTTNSRGGLVLAVLASAMLIYVIDTTIMKVSIRALVQDLDTDVSGVQTAVALYALVIAAFLLTGAKLGDVGHRGSELGGRDVGDEAPDAEGSEE